MASPRDAFVGRWRIVSMEVWDELDLLGPAFIEFEPRNGGMFQFVAVSGDIDYRVSTERDEGIVEWSWLGDDDGEETGGRGWAVREGDNLIGHFYLHRGDDFAFVASPAVHANPRRVCAEPIPMLTRRVQVTDSEWTSIGFSPYAMLREGSRGHRHAGS